ncbi:u-spanin [Escherichia phage JohannLBurckhardt]|uniref:U-spanin n=1 Tax=Escherichia phage JohannLBurckhardt TaxID=2851975 RepID=A0AAE7VUZ8_9CAUD|nr:u-spanin [Escherichia phage JohannLBurckhardt]
MKRLALAVLVAASLSGCSASSALSGLVGSKPEITAQAGAENVKQTVGVTAKNDESSKQENTIKDSQVGKVDSSNKKKVSTSSIQAETITADKIEIRNSESDLYVIFFALACLFVAGFAAGVFWKGRKNKGA